MNLSRLRTPRATFVAVLTLLAVLSGCSKEDQLTPMPEADLPEACYAAMDYQDTLHIDYALRTDLYSCHNIVFQFREGGRLDLYSRGHLSAETLSDTVDLISYDDYAAYRDGVVAVFCTDLYPYGEYISRGRLVLRRDGDRYVVDLLGATESGLGFRSQFTGRVHDLTAPSTQGSLTLGDKSIDFHVAICCQDDSLYTYHLLGGNPYDECVVTAATELAGRTLTISDDPAQIASGNAAGITISVPYGFHATATAGTLQCSAYGDIYTLALSCTTDQGPATALFTGPVFWR